mmetsp:Transcript_23775/g.43244  ORF Transcript_23775/g.43244 Transcript_23775/m.43244 type:complete len:387 (-) Transcript_23775:6-1166(-)
MYFGRSALLAHIAIALDLPEVPVPRFVSIGTHPGPVSAVDDVFTTNEVGKIRDIVLALSDAARGPKGGIQFGNRGGFEGLYSWGIFFTQEGLLALADQFPPLRAFFEEAIDPESNCFLLNSVVTKPGTRQSPPEHGWATGLHLDNTMARFAEEMEGSSARTVSILYLQSGVGPGMRGGELEVFDDGLKYELKVMQQLDDPRHCPNDPSCAEGLSARLLKPHLAARVSPLPGRLVQFNGSLPHAVRATPDTHPAASARDSLRVSLILEQFSYPAHFLRDVPTLAFSIGNGKGMDSENWHGKWCDSDEVFRWCEVQILNHEPEEKWMGCRWTEYRAFGSRVDEAGFASCSLDVRMHNASGTVLDCLKRHLHASKPCAELETSHNTAEL